MRKFILSWTLRDLHQRFYEINFPEYQRESNIWSLDAKQRLIDSVSRHFDIAPIYLYENLDGTLDCIDGRQRINTLMAFLGVNEGDDHNGFAFRIKNELYHDSDHPLEGFSGKTYREIRESADEGDEASRAVIQELLGYELMVVALAGSELPEEFNLQFARLNLGMVINAGEKLHAMIGAMRDICFEDPRIGRHPFLEALGIPTRRFAREQVAAQILAQIFSLEETGGFTKARHFDLQRFFKDKVAIDPNSPLIGDVARTFDALLTATHGRNLLRNRAIAVSVVLIAWRRRFFDDQALAGRFADFLDEFLCRLTWQIRKQLDMDREYRYLTDFQRYVTQASVERSAVEGRTLMLEAAFDRWLLTHDFVGDAEYRERTGQDPGRDCRGAANPRQQPAVEQVNVPSER